MSDGNSSSEEQEEKIHNKYPCKTCGRELRANALYNHVVKKKTKQNKRLKRKVGDVGKLGGSGISHHTFLFLISFV